LSSSFTHSLLQTLQTELQRLTQGAASDSLLVGFSGGMDSTVLLHALHALGLPVAAAHINYCLRGEESSQDADFCAQFCAERKIPYHLYTVQPSDFVAGLSIQVNARNIRYAWFANVCRQFHYHHVLTGHHLDDQVETAVMQWLRRKQADIWRPIPQMNHSIFRPLLHIPRQTLEAYAAANSVAFRHDSSNDDDAYLRNQIRHHIIPEMKQVQPSLLSHIQERLSVYEAQFQMASQWLDLHLPQCLSTVEGVSKLNIEKFDLAFGAQSQAAFQMVMTQWHEPHAVYIQVLKIWNSIPGKQVSGTHALFIKDRNEICRVPYSNQADVGFIQAGDTEVVWNHFRFVISTFPHPAGYVPPDDAHILTMDASKLRWPIKLRIRQTGDTMKPLGMKGNKKVSDILTDIKMAVDQKSKAYVIESSDSIIYVQDFRIASQVRLSNQTRQIVQIQIYSLKA